MGYPLHPGRDLEPETGVSPPLWTDIHTEKITSRCTWYAGSTNGIPVHGWGTGYGIIHLWFSLSKIQPQPGDGVGVLAPTFDADSTSARNFYQFDGIVRLFLRYLLASNSVDYI